MSGEAGKGDDTRVSDWKAYYACPLWENLKKKKVLRDGVHIGIVEDVTFEENGDVVAHCTITNGERINGIIGCDFDKKKEAKKYGKTVTFDEAEVLDDTLTQELFKPNPEYKPMKQLIIEEEDAKLLGGAKHDIRQAVVDEVIKDFDKKNEEKINPHGVKLRTEKGFSWFEDDKDEMPDGVM